MAKKVLSVALVLCMFLGIFALDAAAAGVKVGNYGGAFGDIIPIDRNGKAVSTEYLYGARDYLRFTFKASSNENAVACFEIYPDKNYEKDPIGSAAFSLYGMGISDYSIAVDASTFPKSGTYYAAAYAAEIDGENVRVDYDTFRKFKIVVDKSTSDIKKQTVVFTSATTINGPKVKWYAVKGASNYYVYRKAKESDPWKRIATLGSSARNYTDKSVAAKTGEYIYTVKAVKSDGKASKFEPLAYVYVAPVKTVKVSLTSDDTVNVSWSKAAGVTGYIVYRKTEGGSWKRIGSVHGASTCKFADKTKKTSGTKYIYTVKSMYGYDLTRYYGSYISGTAVTYVAAPVIKSVTDVDGNAVIKWAKVTGAKKYTVYRNSATDNYERTWQKLATVSASTLSYTDKTAEPGKVYDYTVRSEGADNRGSYSYLGTGFAGAPVITSVAETYYNFITIKWEKAAFSDYSVYRKTADSDWKYLGKSSSSSYTDNTAKENGETYIYSVKQNSKYYYTQAESVLADGVSIQHIAAPVLLTPEAEGDFVKVLWEPVEGAVAYTVYRKNAYTDPSWKNVGKVTDSAACSFVDESASAGTSYIYTVRAEGAAIRGSYHGDGIAYTPVVTEQQIVTAE